MLKRPFVLRSVIKKPSIYCSFLGTYCHQANETSTGRMCASRIDEDVIDMAEQLDLTDRGGRRGARGGRPKARGGGGGGSRGHKAGGNGGGEMNREIAISKALSKLLRHAAVDAGLRLDQEGFARVDQVVSIC
jgi:2'-phosphotransferase